jgi:hypothetical protein
VVEAPVLFDKWFEERETQAAESWRIQRAYQRPMDRNETLAISAFQPSPWRVEHGATRVGCVACEGARYAEDPWRDSFQADQNQNFQLESLILAQNERWRQA